MKSDNRKNERKVRKKRGNSSKMRSVGKTLQRFYLQQRFYLRQQ